MRSRRRDRTSLIGDGDAGEHHAAQPVAASEFATAARHVHDDVVGLVGLVGADRHPQHHHVPSQHVQDLEEGRV